MKPARSYLRSVWGVHFQTLGHHAYHIDSPGLSHTIHTRCQLSLFLYASNNRLSKFIYYICLTLYHILTYNKQYIDTYHIN